MLNDKNGRRLAPKSERVNGDRLPKVLRITPTERYRFYARGSNRNIASKTVRAVLEKTGGNISATARRLGCYRRQLQRYLGRRNTAPAPYARHGIRHWHGTISRDTLVVALRMTGGSVSAAARRVGNHRRQVQRWIRRYDITAAEAPGLHKAQRGRVKRTKD